jgi:hypothetical protein
VEGAFAFIGFAAVAFFVGRPVIKLLAGAVYPIQISGRWCLCDRLKEEGVEPRAIPELCLQQITDMCIKRGKWLSKENGSPWKAEAIVELRYAASYMARFIRGEPPTDNYFSEMPEILSTYGLIGRR